MSFQVRIVKSMGIFVNAEDYCAIFRVSHTKVVECRSLSNHT